VPSAEFWPRRSPDDVPFNINFLELTMPVNLYPLTWLLSNGQLFMQVSQEHSLIRKDLLTLNRRTGWMDEYSLRL